MLPDNKNYLQLMVLVSIFVFSFETLVFKVTQIICTQPNYAIDTNMQTLSHNQTKFPCFIRSLNEYHRSYNAYSHAKTFSMNCISHIQFPVLLEAETFVISGIAPMFIKARQKIFYKSLTLNNLEDDRKLLPEILNFVFCIKNTQPTSPILFRQRRDTPVETTTGETTSAAETTTTTTTTKKPGEANETTATTPETGPGTKDKQNGIPWWVWVLIGVVVIIFLITCLAIILYMNANKQTEEPPASNEEIEESESSSSESESDEDEQRLHRNRRHISNCSYCPQTLQRYNNDRPCGRNCCETELYEQRTISGS